MEIVRKGTQPLTKTTRTATVRTPQAALVYPQIQLKPNCFTGKSAYPFRLLASNTTETKFMCLVFMGARTCSSVRMLMTASSPSKQALPSRAQLKSVGSSFREGPLDSKARERTRGFGKAREGSQRPESRMMRQGYEINTESTNTAPCRT
jgi:hypothetical protein